MEKNVTAQSFIVRVYRMDGEDRRKIAGLVEPLDGSDKPAPFRDADELTLLLNRGACGLRAKKRAEPRLAGYAPASGTAAIRRGPEGRFRPCLQGMNKWPWSQAKV